MEGIKKQNDNIQDVLANINKKVDAMDKRKDPTPIITTTPYWNQPHNYNQMPPNYYQYYGGY